MPLRRTIFNTLTVVSLLLLPGVLATVGLWVARSFSVLFHTPKALDAIAQSRGAAAHSGSLH